MLSRIFVAIVLLASAPSGAALFDAKAGTAAPSVIYKFIADNAPDLKIFSESTKAAESTLSGELADARVKRAADLEHQLKGLRDRKISAIKKIESKQRELAAKKLSLQSSGDTAKAMSTAAAKDLMRIYDDHLQCFNQMLIVFKELPTVLEGHIGLLKNQADDALRKVLELSQKIVYSIDDYHSLDKYIEEVEELVQKNIQLRQNSGKNRKASQESISVLRKKLELNKKELDALISNKPKHDEVQGDASQLSYAERERILRAEERLREDEIRLAELKLEKLDLEQAHNKDEVALLENRAKALAAVLSKVKRNIVIDVDDVDRAKAEKDSQDVLLAEEKERIRKSIGEKNAEKERLQEHYEALKGRLETLRSQDQGETSEIYFYQAREWRDKNVLKQLDAQILLLGLDEELAAMEANIKAFEFKSIDIWHRLLAREDSNLSVWLEGIINSKRGVENNLEKYKTQKENAEAVLLPAMQKELDRLKRKQSALTGGDLQLFVGYEDDRQKTEEFLAEAQVAVRQQIAQTQKFISRAGDIIQGYERLKKQYGRLEDELDMKRGNVNIWRRSARGISIFMIFKAFDDAQNFSKNLFWRTHDFFDATGFFKRFSLAGIFGLLLFCLIYWLGFLVMRGLLAVVRRRIQLFTSYQKGNFVFWYLNVILLFFDAAQRHFALFYALCFVYFQIKLKATYYGFFAFANQDYALAGFYLVAMGVWTYLCSDFLFELRLLNVRLSYFFFSERNQRRIMSLVSLLLHSTALIFPFRSALSAYGTRYESLPTVLFAAYSLIVIVSLAFLFDKDDVLGFIPSRSDTWLSIRSKIDSYFYPGFFFAVLLFILANPYVGYSQLAWYLAFFVPISVCVIFVASWIYGALRKQVLWIFIDERDDERVERFEYARVYYGFFVTVSFLSLLFLIIGIFSQIWGLPYNFTRLWLAVTKEWTLILSVGDTTKVELGIIEFIIMYVFMASGYLASTLANRFVLSKVFEVFGAEPGAQNTFSRILHIIFLIMAFIMGLSFIGLSSIVLWLLSWLLVVVGFGAKDLVADFVAGLLILLERQVEIGHYIVADAQRGTVHKISARSTIIRTSQNYFVVIPNRNLISHPIINWGAGRYSVGFELTVNTCFENDPDLVLETLRRVLNAHPLILRVPAISVRLENFTPQGADFFVRAFVSIRKVREQWDIASDVRIAIYKAFREKGIVFPYPRMILYQNQNKHDDASSFFRFKFDNEIASQNFD